MSKILIAEDNEQSLYMLQALLQGKGHEVIIARNGREALEALKSTKPDVVISDIMMPEMDGFALCQECKVSAEYKAIPFVFYTATYTDPRDEELAMDLGACRFIIKPLEPEKFIEMVDEVLGEFTQGAINSPQSPLKDVAELEKLHGMALHRKLESKIAELQEVNEGLEREIAERRKAERDLRASEERFRTLVNAAPTTIICLAKDLSVTDFNPEAEQVFGIKRKSAIGMDFVQQFLPMEARKRAETEFRLVLAGAPSRSFETVVAVAGGQLVEYLWSIDRVTCEHIGATGLIAVGQDISQRKLAEESRLKFEREIQRTHKLESLGILAGGIAHDFNNILAAIMGFTELCLLEAESGSSMESSLQEIFGAGKRAKELVARILAFSRQAPPESKPVQLGPIVDEVTKLMRASLPVTIEIEKKTDTEAWAMADPSQIHQVLMNLCVNAGKAMQEDGGVLGVSLREETPDVSFTERHSIEPGTYLHLAVSDTGCGMPEEVRRRIFEPFFTTREKGKGLGLGLSVVHGIIKNHKGAITVDSSPGHSTVFNVYLPVHDEAGSITEEEQPAPHGHARILFVDDEESIAILNMEMLSYLGFQVVSKTDPEEALKAFADEPQGFDMLISDMTMPKLKGDALTEKVREIRPDIPVIICTGYTAGISDETARDIGIDALLMKPVSMSEMARTIKGLLSSRRSD